MSITIDKTTYDYQSCSYEENSEQWIFYITNLSKDITKFEYQTTTIRL